MRKKQGIFKMALVNFIYFPHGCVLGRRRFNVETPCTSLNEEGIGSGSGVWLLTYFAEMTLQQPSSFGFAEQLWWCCLAGDL